MHGFNFAPRPAQSAGIVPAKLCKILHTVAKTIRLDRDLQGTIVEDTGA